MPDGPIDTRDPQRPVEDRRVREQLEALEELSRTDLAFRQIDVELSEVDSQLTELRSNVDKIRELLDRERQQLADADKLRLSHQAELEMIAEKALRSKKRQEQARNNRETEATTRELDVLKREKEERTAEADRLAQVVVEVNASIVRHEGDFAELAKHLADEEAVARGRREDLLGRKRAMEDERKAITSRVRADILRTYTMAFTRRGSGVSECTGGICRGCHVTLPPQLYNQILRADRVYQCPNCNRILLVPRAATPR